MPCSYDDVSNLLPIVIIYLINACHVMMLSPNNKIGNNIIIGNNINMNNPVVPYERELWL